MLQACASYDSLFSRSQNSLGCWVWVNLYRKSSKNRTEEDDLNVANIDEQNSLSI